MNFIVRDKEGKDHGPVPQEVLVKWTQEGLVRPDTRVRNAMLQVWKEATEFEFLSKALSEQPEEEEVKGFWETAGDILSVASALKKPTTIRSTAFEYKHLPNPAPFYRRLFAAVFDVALLMLVCFLLSAFSYTTLHMSAKAESLKRERAKAGNQQAAEAKDGAGAATADTAAPSSDKKASPESEKDSPPAPAKKDNLEASAEPSVRNDSKEGYGVGSLWSFGGVKYICWSGEEGRAVWGRLDDVRASACRIVFVMCLVYLLYYGFGLGFFAQTFGMWFWGIFIVKNNRALSEALPLRCHVYSILLALVGWTTPLFVVSNSKRLALQNLLTRTMIICVAAKPRA